MAGIFVSGAYMLITCEVHVTVGCGLVVGSVTYIYNVVIIFLWWYMPITWNVVHKVCVQCSWSYAWWLVTSNLAHVYIDPTYTPRIYGNSVKCVDLFVCGSTQCAVL